MAGRAASAAGLMANMKPIFNTIVTNVPGAQVPMYMSGAKMVRSLGAGPCVDSMGLFPPVTSYNGMISISVLFDYTDFPMFGGGVDMIYDPNAIEFAQFVQGMFQQDVYLVSPIGVITEPGLISNLGVTTTDFFNGIGGQGAVGTFYFNILGASDAGATPCGMLLCIVPNATNPFVSLAGSEVTDEILGNGIAGASIALPVPLPAAIWFMLSGLGLLVRLRR